VLRSVSEEALRTKPQLTRNQVRSFWAAWGGWTMDGMDSFRRGSSPNDCTQVECWQRTKTQNQESAE
jgi:hypothetical protein